ncbi:MAG: ATP-dependent DNA ligase [Gemmatimonadaceae bacterium]|nr:ATP-dependent DNA ligase [Gemmatimonadaceae bacterium]
MLQFAELYDRIDRTTATHGKTAALVWYFERASAADAAWALAFLLGRRPKRLMKAGDLRTAAREAAEIPEWLFDECYAQVGDLAETIALLVPTSTRASVAPERDTPEAHTEARDSSLAWWIEQQLLPLGALAGQAQREAVRRCWSQLHGTARFLFLKLITGSFRVGISDGLVVRALSQVSGVHVDTLAHRLMGQWDPTPAFFERLLNAETADTDWSRPFPFFLAHPLPHAVDDLGSVADWQIEWKWDGIRAQIVRRRGRTMIWSRGEELLSGRFPEIETVTEWLPDGTVLDGEIVAWEQGAPRPFTSLQRRLNRKSVGKKLLAEVPCQFVAYDCLEYAATDLRARALTERRAQLEQIIASLPSGATMSLSPLLMPTSWEAAHALRAGAREARAEGLMLKRRTSAYGVGRRGNDWYKWKVTPLTVDAVLIAAQPGHGRRAGLFTDYTFAVWDGGTLVTFAKAYSGLTDAEIREVDAFVRRNTIEKFGPVRTVTPSLVFELAFEGIQVSARHKSGIAVRFPRIARRRTDKVAADADTLDRIRAMLHNAGS